LGSYNNSIINLPEPIETTAKKANKTAMDNTAKRVITG